MSLSLNDHALSGVLYRVVTTTRPGPAGTAYSVFETAKGAKVEVGLPIAEAQTRANKMNAHAEEQGYVVRYQINAVI